MRFNRKKIWILGLMSCFSFSYAGKIHKAVKRGDVELVKRLIAAGADVNKKPMFGKLFPLHLAAQNGHADVVEVLLDKGAGIDQTINEYTPLHFATQGGYYDVVQKLVEKKANVNIQGRNKFTALHYAVENKHLAIAEYLLAHNADLDLNCANNVYVIDFISDDPVYAIGALKPVFLAAINKNAALLRLFSKNGSLSERNGKGYTLVHAAAHGITSQLESDIIETISYVSNTDESLRDKCTISNSYSLVPIAFALNDMLPYASEKAGYRALVSLLIPKFKKQSVEFKNSLTDCLVSLDKTSEHREFLLDQLDGFSMTDHPIPINGGQIMYNCFLYGSVFSGSDTTSEILSSIENDKRVKFKQLIKKKKNLNKKKQGRTFLGFAALFGRYEMVKLLIDAGAKVNVVQKDGLTPVICATLRGYRKIVELLLQHGADPNIADKKRLTPFHYAAALGRDKILELLIVKQMNANVFDKLGKTPLHNARANCIPLLIKAGAKVNVQDKNGWTPLHWAVHWADVDRVRELLKAGANPKIKNKIKNKEGHIPLWFISRDYKTFVPGEFTKPIVDMLVNPALASKAVATTSTAPIDLESRATSTSTSTSTTTFNR